MPLKPLSPPPITQPVTQDNGRLNLAWTKWLNEVQQKANAFAGQVFQAARVSFIGRSTNGAVTTSDEYNIESLERVSVGRYEGEITQQTAYGVNLLDNAVGAVSHILAPSADTQTFFAEFSVLTTTTFAVEVFEVTQGVSPDVDLVLYDPDEAGDVVTLAIHTTISSELPPA